MNLRTGIDILTNNAGYSVRSAVEEIEIDKLKNMMDVNVFGMILTHVKEIFMSVILLFEVNRQSLMSKHVQKGWFRSMRKGN